MCARGERDGLYTFTVPCKWVGRHYRYFSLSIDIPLDIIVGEPDIVKYNLLPILIAHYSSLYFNNENFHTEERVITPLLVEPVPSSNVSQSLEGRQDVHTRYQEEPTCLICSSARGQVSEEGGQSLIEVDSEEIPLEDDSVPPALTIDAGAESLDGGNLTSLYSSSLSRGRPRTIVGGIQPCSCVCSRGKPRVLTEEWPPRPLYGYIKSCFTNRGKPRVLTEE